MTRFKNVNGINVQLTEAEETQRDIDEANAIAEQQAKPIIKEYQTNRKNEYPEIGDQLDMLWHSIDQNPKLKSEYFEFYEAIKAVKVKHPKNG